MWLSVATRSPDPAPILVGVVAMFLGVLLAVPAEADDWRLAGTLQTGEGAALLETPAGQQLLRIREQVGDCRLDAVSKNTATFTCEGQSEILRLGARLPYDIALQEHNDSYGDYDNSNRADVLSSEPVSLAQSDVRARVADRQRLVEELSLEPVTGAAGIEGYRLQSVTPDSLAAQAGFVADDIVRSVNGVPVSAGSGFMQVLNNLGDAVQVLIEVERSGERLQRLVLLN